MSRGRPLLLAVLVASTVSALAAAESAAAAAGGGTSANAKLCQKGGWRDLVTSTGAGFASQGDCVSYAAHGGTPLTRYQYRQSRYEAICAQYNASFSSGEAAWSCRSGIGSLTEDSYDALSTLCQEAGGTPSRAGSRNEYYYVNCDDIPADPGLPAAPGPDEGRPGLVGVQVTVAGTEARVLLLRAGPVELELSILPPSGSTARSG